MGRDGFHNLTDDEAVGWGLIDKTPTSRAEDVERIPALFVLEKALSAEYVAAVRAMGDDLANHEDQMTVERPHIA
ncbi:hypothetical protein PM082_007176 [Marasmius tenuissimus]|nr:hypothetical protein PM082_007176 [Marasmius tenuissimus]